MMGSNPFLDMMEEDWLDSGPEDVEIGSFDLTTGQPFVERPDFDVVEHFDNAIEPSNRVIPKPNKFLDIMKEDWEQEEMDSVARNDLVNSVFDISADVGIGILDKIRFPLPEDFFPAAARNTTFQQAAELFPSNQRIINHAIDGLQGLLDEDGTVNAPREAGRFIGNAARFYAMAYATGGISTLQANTLYTNSFRAGLAGLATRLLEPGTEDGDMLSRLDSAFKDSAMTYLFTLGVGGVLSQLPKLGAGGTATKQWLGKIWDKVHSFATKGAKGVKPMTKEVAKVFTDTTMDIVTKNTNGGKDLVKYFGAKVAKANRAAVPIETARRAYWAVARKLDLPDDVRRGLLHQDFGVDSSNQLEVDQLVEAREKLKFLGRELGPKNTELNFGKDLAKEIKKPPTPVGSQLQPGFVSEFRPVHRVLFDIGEQKAWRQIMHNEVGKLDESFHMDGELQVLRNLGKKEKWDMDRHSTLSRSIPTNPQDTEQDVFNKIVSHVSTETFEGIPKNLEPLAKLVQEFDSPEEFQLAFGIADPRWGTANQYLLQNPFRNQLMQMAKTKKFDENIITKASVWEMEQVLIDKPAFLADQGFPGKLVRDFATKNNLPLGELDGKLVVGKTKVAVDRVIKAKDQRELGLALGYKDIGHQFKSIKEFKTFFNQAKEGRKLISSIPQSEILALTKERVLLTDAWRRRVKQLNQMANSGLVTKKQLQNLTPAWNPRYNPRFYKERGLPQPTAFSGDKLNRELVTGIFGSNNNGLSMDEYRLLKKDKWGTDIPNRFLNARTVEMTDAELDSVLDKTDHYKHLGIVLRSAYKQIHHEPFLRSWMKSWDRPDKNLTGPVREYLTDFVNYGVINRAHKYDAKWERTFKFNAKRTAARVKSFGYMGTMFMNPVPWTKQMLQQSHNFSQVGAKFWLKGIDGLIRSGSKNPLNRNLVFTKQNGELFDVGMNAVEHAFKHSPLLRGRRYQIFHDLDWSDPQSLYNGFIKIGMAPYRLLDFTNIIVGYNGGVAKALSEGKNIKVARQRGNDIAEIAQYNYLNIAKPLFFHHSLGSLGGQFMSWPLGYGEMFWSMGGQYKSGGPSAKNVTEQFAKIGSSKELARYISLMAGLIAALDAMGVDFGTKKLLETSTGAALIPTGLGNSPNLVINTGQAMLTGAAIALGKDDFYTKRKFNIAMNGVQQALPSHVVPGSVAMRKLYKITGADFLEPRAEEELHLRGELPWYSLFLPINSREYEQQRQKAREEWDNRSSDWYD